MVLLMMQTLHLLVVDAERGRTLVAQHGSRWLLPMLSLPESARAGPTLAAWGASVGINTRICGQWLGRLRPVGDGVDWLTVLTALADAQPLRGDVGWAPFEVIRDKTALHDYQRWAVDSAFANGEQPCVSGSFGRLTWWAAVNQWASIVLMRDLSDADVQVHRATNSEVVVEWRLDGRRWFCKGLTPNRSREAWLTMRLGAAEPDVFARTCGHSRREDGSLWWLMEECKGRSLSEACTLERTITVAAACSAVQHRTQALCTEVLGEAALDLDDLARWAGEATRGRERRSFTQGAVERGCGQVCRAQHPTAWVAGDLDPANVILEGDRVRFIDLDEAILGPAPLSLATFARRVGGDRAWRRRLFEPFAATWDLPPLSDETLAAYDLVSRLVECRSAWEQAARNDELGHTVGVLEFARRQIATRVERCAAACLANGLT